MARLIKYLTLRNIIILGALVRVAFVLLMGSDHHRLATDSYWILGLSEKALLGNFDFDDGRFIIAPFYPVFVAGIKLIFSSYWEYVLSFLQITLSISSIFFIERIAFTIFNDKRVSLISALIFSVFPFTFWWINTFSTESVFQGLFIISVYFLIKARIAGSYKFTILSSVFFSFCFLTKSHVLLYSPFIVLVFFLIKESSLQRKVTLSGIYGGICLLFTLPFGLYNLEKHETYVLASNGAKYHFYTGNSEYGYHAIVDVPNQDTKAYGAVKAMRYGYFHGDIHNDYLALPQKDKQNAFFKYSLIWIKNNPKKFFKLKITNIFFFLFPGVSYKHYPPLQWFLSFLMSCPIYFLAYFGIVKSLKINFKKHFWIFGLFLSLFLFSSIWYAQNRFRTLTIEPFYFIYCSYFFVYLVDKWNSKKDLKTL